MPDAHIYLLIEQLHLATLLNDTLMTAGYQVESHELGPKAASSLRKTSFDVLFLEATADEGVTFALVDAALDDDPLRAVILLASSSSQSLLRNAIQAGVADFLVLPVTSDDLLAACRKALARQKKMRNARFPIPVPEADDSQGSIDSLRKMGAIGRSLTASLDLDYILKAVVDAAVRITGAEEGSLLILEGDSNELVMRAAKNFQDEFVRMFRLPVNDTLAGDVIQTGRPVIINQDSPQKIITEYLVRSLMYVPLRVGGRVIGVLGVDNRQNVAEFSQEQLSLVSTLADYAAIAIDNARLYQTSEDERQKLDLILGQIADAVIVVSPDYRLLLVNHKARQLFNLEADEIEGESLEVIFQEEPLIELFKTAHLEMPYHEEISLEDGYVLSAHLVEIPDIGFAATMQDITYFKELDRVKTEFVNTVSHDLRSPLTAILGYVQLINRVGEVSTQQQEFIDRIQVNVTSISELINSLLELGRIETGLDAFKENVHLADIVQYALDDLRYLVEDRCQVVQFECASDLPKLFGDPIRLRQVVENLLTNAILYTPNEGQISIRLDAEGDQVILQVRDNGVGILQPEQPYIFDKFFRGSNIPEDTSGSGLGLAIVQTIVENHNGRVWVESKPGAGSCFTVVLPLEG